ncbi:legume-like lectin family-domain-containing protein [Syncephalis fuscata]|nr:legume-like lectin family-domain-containing protein [Syncephalis fuscata]
MRLSTTFSGIALSLLALGVATTANDEESQVLRTHSLYVPFVDEELRIRYWDYGGDAIIDANNHIRLTPDLPSRRGWLWSKLPLPEEAWQVEFEFKVHGTGHIFGDGFAMWATKDRTQEGPVFGSRDFFKGLGLFFDTYMNHNSEHYYPFVMAMIGDGKTPYDDANDGKANHIASCESDFRNIDRSTRARVTYYKGSQLKVELLVKNDHDYDVCFTIDQKVTLPTPAYLGFSSHTGDVSDNHDITWISATEIANKPPMIMTNNPYINQTPSGSALGFFFKLVLFSVICGVGVIGYRMYQKQGNKRF